MASSSSAPESSKHSMPGDTSRISENMLGLTSTASSSMPDSLHANMPNGTSSTNGTTHAISTPASSSEGLSANLDMGKEQRVQALKAIERTPSSQPVEREEASDSVPLMSKIKKLGNKCAPDPLWNTSLPGANEPSLKLQERAESVNWGCMLAKLAHFAPEKEILTKDILLRVIASPGIVAILVDWKKDVLDADPDDGDEFRVGQLYAFTYDDHTNTKEAHLLASCAWYLPVLEARGLSFKQDHRHDIMQSAPTVKLAEGMKHYVMQYLDPSVFPDIERFLYELCARILIMAYTDLDKSKDGFFGVLLGSVFAYLMSPEARDKWEGHLGLNHKVVKDTPEHLSPFISIHTAALAFSHKWGVQSLKRKNPGDKTMKVSERAIISNTRLSELQRVLHAEADSDPRLLTAFNVTAPPLPPTTLPPRIIHNSAYYQPAIPVPPKQSQHKRGRGAKATVQEEGSASSKTTKPKVAPKLPTQTRTATDISTPLEVTSAPESNTHVSATGKKRKVAATSSSSDPNLSTHNKKRGRKVSATTSSDEPTHPKPQEDAVSTQPKDSIDLQENGAAVAITVPDAGEAPEVNNKSAPLPVQDQSFATVNGRIVPSGRRTTLRAKSDRFTNRQQLTLYTKYMEVVTEHCTQGRYQLTAEQWFQLWQEVANVLPGRSVISCIEFYVENEEHFWF